VTIVYAPLDGRVLAMSDVPDPVFSEAMLGPGIAIDPVARDRVDVASPVNGTVRTVFPHALAVQTAQGLGVLVHLGFETADLHGDGFVVSVTAGDVVEIGQVAISWSPRSVALTGRSAITTIVALQAAPEDLTLLVKPGARVRVGEPLFDWRACAASARRTPSRDSTTSRRRAGLRSPGSASQASVRARTSTPVDASSPARRVG
jgi:PTS system glucose-specific IIA component